MRAVIIGAGIGGLAAAVALRRVGIECLVIERVAEVREVGAGLSIWSNAVNALRELRVDVKVMAAGSVVERIVSQTPAGRFIAVSELADISREAGAPSICVRRAVLQRILLEELPPEWIRTGTQCIGFEESTAILENGQRLEADVLVGADGISSAIRDGLHGAEPPRYAGYHCWRGMLRDEGVLADRSALLSTGAGTQFGLWPGGPDQLYWFLTRNAPQGAPHTKTEAVALCRNWAAPIPGIIENTPEDAILQNDILDRPPFRWSGRGRVTLLGDAAHATTPNLGQGACQALEDAVILAHCLRGVQPAEAALRDYERLRIPRTTAIVRDSWRSGRILQLDRPALETLRNWAMGTSLSTRLATKMLRNLLLYRLPGL